MKKLGAYVYILTNTTNSVLYTGVTADLTKRINQHLRGTGSGFTKKYHLTKLVYVETFESITEAIAREKQIKAGSRAKKIQLIEKLNSRWQELNAGAYE
jgi:putative endonuclease